MQRLIKTTTDSRKNAKVIIDATRPATLPFEEAIKPPQEAWNRIKLEDYLD